MKIEGYYSREIHLLLHSDACYWSRRDRVKKILLIGHSWSQKGVNWLSRSRQNACRENMLNSNSDWPHGSADAAFIIAFAWCFLVVSTFAVTCNVMERKIASWWCKWCLWLSSPPLRLTSENGFFHINKNSQSAVPGMVNTDGSKSRERAAAVLTTFTGQGGICHGERERERRGEQGQGERENDD